MSMICCNVRERLPFQFLELVSERNLVFVWRFKLPYCCFYPRRSRDPYLLRTSKTQFAHQAFELGL
jgi:hypothetical protein